MRRALLILLGAVGFMLLIAWRERGEPLLARGAERRRELAGIGAALGIALAHVGVRTLIAVSPPGLPRLDAVRIDARVLVFAVGIAPLTALLFGLAPALSLSRTDLQETFRSGGRSATAGRERNRLRRALVVSEIALAMVLLIGSGLLIRSFVSMLRNDIGFQVENRATLQAFLNPTPRSGSRGPRRSSSGRPRFRASRARPAASKQPKQGWVWQFGSKRSGRRAPAQNFLHRFSSGQFIDQLVEIANFPHHGFFVEVLQ